jgi:hypothetical protein
VFKQKLFRPSGGLVYHWRAGRYADSLWTPFRDELAELLRQWPADKRNLWILGASGGYTLTSTWLDEFDAIHVVDTDPLAGFFFRRRHWQLRGKIDVHPLNILTAGTVPWELNPEVFAARLTGSILFSNVLGQLPLEHPTQEDAFRSFLVSLRAQLASSSWASYHDVISAEGLTQWDHLTDGTWTDGLPKARLDWRLTPRRSHLVEAVWHTPTDNPR